MEDREKELGIILMQCKSPDYLAQAGRHDLRMPTGSAFQHDADLLIPEGFVFQSTAARRMRDGGEPRARSPITSAPTPPPPMKLNPPLSSCSRRNWTLTLTTLATLAFSLLCEDTAQASPLKIMPLGDSITRGSNRINYPNGSIPGGYRRELGLRLSSAGISYDFVGSRSDNAAPGMDPHHNGVDGIRTDQVLANINNWLGTNPDVVLMHLGTNDMLQHVPIGTAIGNLGTLITRITQNAPNRKLYVSTIIPIDEARDGRSAAEWGGIVSSYNSQVKNLVQSHIHQGRNVSLIDMHASIVYTNPNPYYNFFQVGDRTHPGQAGYDQMGAIWSRALISSGPPPPPPPAGPNLLVNGAFATDYSGWSHSGNQGVVPPASYSSPSGSKLVAFNGGNSTPNGVLSQSFSTVAGSSYRITFHAGVIAWNRLQQRLGIEAGPLSQTITFTGGGGGSVQWISHTFDFIANSNQTTLRFRDLSSHTNSLDLLLTNIAVTGQAGSGNTAPVASPDQYALTTGSTLSIAAPGVLANDTDAQSNPLTAVLVTQASHGNVTLHPNGSFTYTPFPGFSGTDSFTYQARDASLSSSPAAVTLTASPPSQDLLVNADFESGFNGWSASGNLAPKNSPPYTSTSGSGLVAFNDGNRQPGGSISQSFTTVAGRSYAVSYDVGTYSFNTTLQALHFSVRGNTSLFQESTTLRGVNGGIIRWTTKSHNFTADGSLTTITFSDISPGTNGIDLLLDQVRLVEGPAPAAAKGITVPNPHDGLKAGVATMEITSGAIAIRTLATGSGLYFLESSPDLKDWKRILERRVEHAGPLEFIQPVTPEEERPERLFYRVGSSSP